MTIKTLNQTGEKWAYRILVAAFISLVVIGPIQYNYIMHKNDRDFTALTPAQKEQYVALERQYWDLKNAEAEIVKYPGESHSMGYGEAISKASDTHYQLTQIEQTLPHTSWAKKFYETIGAINE
jgi:hypothetical protein